MHQPKQIQFIQALRGIAAFMVFGWHEMSSFNTPIESDVFNFIFKNGIAGVDVFFVISGFIMIIVAGGKLQGSKDASDFFIKRVSRIWPPYVVATICYLLFMWNSGWLDSVAIRDFIPSILFIPTASGSPSLGVGWTLNLEILFYLFFAIGMLFGSLRWPFMVAVFVLISCLKFSVLGSTGISEYLPSFVNSYFSQSLHASFLEFFAGMVIGKLYLSDIKIARPVGIALGALCCSFAFWQYFSGLWPTVGIMGWGIGSITLIFGLAAADKSGCVWEPPKFLLWLGKISFSLYLMHVTFFAVVTKYLNESGFLPYTKGVGYMAFIITVVLLLSWAFHELVEVRLSKKFSTLLFSLSDKLRNARRKPLPFVGSGGV